MSKLRKQRDEAVKKEDFKEAGKLKKEIASKQKEHEKTIEELITKVRRKRCDFAESALYRCEIKEKTR